MCWVFNSAEKEGNWLLLAMVCPYAMVGFASDGSCMLRGACDLSLQYISVLQTTPNQTVRAETVSPIVPLFKG